MCSIIYIYTFFFKCQSVLFATKQNSEDQNIINYTEVSNNGTELLKRFTKLFNNKTKIPKISIRNNQVMKQHSKKKVNETFE